MTELIDLYMEIYLSHFEFLIIKKCGKYIHIKF